MQTQTTVDTARGLAAHDASEHAAADTDAQVALQRAQELLALAQQTRDAAYARLAESPEDVSEANAAVALAQQTVSELREAARPGQRPNGQRNYAHTLNTLSAAINSASDEVGIHEAGSSSDTAKRTAHHAAAEAKETSRRRTAAPAPAATTRRTPAPALPRLHTPGQPPDNDNQPLGARPSQPITWWGTAFVPGAAVLTQRAADPRNSDGIASVREVAMSTTALLGAAIGSPQRRATAGGIVANIAHAAGQGDRRGMLDGALSFGRGIVRTTGSQDLGAFATNAVGTTVTKSQTAATLVARGDVRQIGRALWRNGSAVFGSVTSFFGMNSLENAVTPYLANLISDPMDFEHLVNPQRVRQFDTNGNGMITADEIVSVLRNNGKGFSELDLDRSGSISYGELRAQLVGIAVRNQARRNNA